MTPAERLAARYWEQYRVWERCWRMLKRGSGQLEKY